MWWSITTNRNVTLVLQFLWFHDMLLWTANKRPEFKMFESHFLLYFFRAFSHYTQSQVQNFMTKYTENY